MRKLIGFVFAGLLLTTAVAAKAQIYTTSSPGVDYATSTTAGFAVNSIGEYSGSAMAMSQGGMFVLQAYGTAYADAGIVLDFNGGLTLGQLQSVTVNAIQGTPVINLWLDTGGDGQFFQFNSSGVMTSTNGDSYGLGDPSIDANSSFYMQGADVGSSPFSYTLAQLQAGAVAGINANTLASLWIGTTDPGGAYGNDQAYIQSVDVQASPEPSSLMLLGTGFLGLVGVMRRKLK